MIKCVAFDMDDTLYDELDYYKSGLAAVASVIAGDHELDDGVVSETIWKVFIGGNHKTTFNETLDKLAIAYRSEDIIKLVNVLRSHSPQISLPVDSRAVLEELMESYKLALITDGFLPAQKLKARALEIEQYFDCMIFTEELGRECWKPSTAAFEKMLEQLGLTAQQCVYVGDNLTKDFIAPNKLGFKTILLTRPNGLHTSPAPEESAQAHYRIENLSQLLNLLERIDV
jgi:putative hydrolase of the HAD superfamily